MSILFYTYTDFGLRKNINPPQSDGVSVLEVVFSWRPVGGCESWALRGCQAASTGCCQPSRMGTASLLSCSSFHLLLILFSALLISLLNVNPTDACKCQSLSRESSISPPKFVKTEKIIYWYFQSSPRITTWTWSSIEAYSETWAGSARWRESSRPSSIGRLQPTCSSWMGKKKQFSVSR